ncbi:MAG: NUDIX hydrolase [Candidatus Paceibacteria bacterium]
MQVLKILREEDVGESFPTPHSYIERTTARAVVFDTDDNIALLHVTRKEHHKLPGGGVEEGESIGEALTRELIEEIGCAVTDVCELGMIEEYRNKTAKHQISYCFTAQVSGEKGTPSLDASEINDGIETVWMGLEDAIRLLEQESRSMDSYGAKFMSLRELAFLKEAHQTRVS